MKAETPAPTNQGARTRFARSAAAKTHNDVVLSAQFIAAADAAMIHFVTDSLPETTDPAESAAQYQRLLGARQFLRVLSTIGVAPSAPIRSKISDNLSE